MERCFDKMIPWFLEMVDTFHWQLVYIWPTVTKFSISTIFKNIHRVYIHQNTKYCKVCKDHLLLSESCIITVCLIMFTKPRFQSCIFICSGNQIIIYVKHNIALLIMWNVKALLLQVQIFGKWNINIEDYIWI